MKRVAQVSRLLFIGVGLFALTVLAQGDPVAVTTLPGIGDVTAIVFCRDGSHGFVSDGFFEDHTIRKFVATGSVTAPYAFLTGQAGFSHREPRGGNLGPKRTKGTALSIACDRLYFADSNQNRVAVLDATAVGAAETIKDLATVSGIIRPRDVVANPFDNPNMPPHQVYAVSSVEDSFAIINTVPTPTLIRKIELRGCEGPNHIDLQGSIAYVACPRSDTVAKVDVIAGTFEIISLNPPGVASERLPQDVVVVRGASGVKGYTANMVSRTVSVLDVVGPPPRRISTIPIGGLITVEADPTFLAASLDGRYVYVSNPPDRSVSIICTRTDRVVKQFSPVPVTSNVALSVAAVSHDGRWLLVVEAGRTIRVWDMSPLYSSPFITTNCP